MKIKHNFAVETLKLAKTLSQKWIILVQSSSDTQSRGTMSAVGAVARIVPAGVTSSLKGKTVARRTSAAAPARRRVVTTAAGRVGTFHVILQSKHQYESQYGM
jgi:hypothetical protein